MTPIWFLDVDGVINAVTRTPDDTWDDYTFVSVDNRSGSWPIRYSPTLVKRIVALHDSGLVEVRWLTTWGSDANVDLASKLGFPQLAVAAEPPFRSREWWKFTAVKNWAAENPDVPVVWTDDDLSYEPEVRTWLTAETRPFMTIAPSSSVGLRPTDIDAITTFAFTHNPVTLG